MEETRKKSHGSALTRTVVKAMGLFGGMQVFAILCGVVRIKLIAIWLGTAGVGMFAIFNSALTIISNLTQLNLRTSSIRAIAAGRADSRLPVILAAVRRLGWWLGLAGAAVMLLAAPVFSLRTFGSYEETPGFMLLAVAVIFLAVSMTEQASLQGLDRLRDLAVSSVRGAVGGLAATVPLVYFLRLDSISWVLIAYGAATWLGVRWSRPDIPLQGPSPRAREVWEIGRPLLVMGFFMTVATVLSEVCSYIFIAYLNHRGGTSEVGLFQSGFTLVNRYMGLVFSAIGVEFYPRLSSVAGSRRRLGTFVSHEMLLLGLIVLGVVSVFIPFAPIGVRLFYSSEFLGIVPYLLLAMPGVVLQGAAWCMAFVILARGDGKIYMYTEVLSTLTIILLNILFYSRWGLAGVGLSFTVSYAVYLAVIYGVCRRRYGLRLPLAVVRAVAGIFFAAAAMSAAGLLVAPSAALVPAVPALVAAALSLRRMLR